MKIHDSDITYKGRKRKRNYMHYNDHLSIIAKKIALNDISNYLQRQKVNVDIKPFKHYSDSWEYWLKYEKKIRVDVLGIILDLKPVKENI